MRKFLLLVLSTALLLSSISDAGYRGGRRGPGPQTRPGRYSRGHGPGRIGYPARIPLGPTPRGGWRGNPYYWSGRNYYVWAYGPAAPFYGWRYYEGWRIGLYYYVPEGLRCNADNPQIPGLWMGQEVYYSSEDAINSALGYCENDPAVMNLGAQANCRIRDCQRW